MGSKPSAVSWALSLESCTRRNRGRLEEITKLAVRERKKGKLEFEGRRITNRCTWVRRGIFFWGIMTFVKNVHRLSVELELWQ